MGPWGGSLFGGHDDFFRCEGAWGVLGGRRGGLKHSKSMQHVYIYIYI